MQTSDPLPGTQGVPLDFAILGGGAAGTLAAIHLLQAHAGRIRLAVIEPRGALGEGVAYSTSDPGHLLNVVAGGMSAFPADPLHFVRYLARSGRVDGLGEGAEARLAERYVPRMEYGRYLRDTLAGLAPAPLHLRDEAVDVSRRSAGNGPWDVRLASGRVVAARTVLLATGNFPRSLPLGDGAAVVDHAWDFDALATVPAEADVAILGSGLSMVDALLSLAAGGHRGTVRVLSRHGLMPLPHVSGRGAAGDVEDLLPLGVRARMQVLRARAAAHAREGRPWQWTMDRLRPHGPRLWQSLGEAGQRRFLRHAHRYWDIHRHRIAPEVAAQVAELQRTGRFRIEAGRIQSVTRCAGPGANRYEITFRARGSDRLDRVRVDRVFACTGIETRLDRMPGELLPALARRGLAVAGPHGLGVATDLNGALLDRDGRAQRDLLAIGSLRIGELWESTAVPELRLQAAALAER